MILLLYMIYIRSPILNRGKHSNYSRFPIVFAVIIMTSDYFPLFKLKIQNGCFIESFTLICLFSI